MTNSRRTILSYSLSDKDRKAHLTKNVKQLLLDTATCKSARVLLANPTAILFDSTLALRANCEAIILMLCFPSILTLIYEPDSIHNNPLLTRLGYNDACVTFDTKPAVYFAICLFCFAVYFCGFHVNHTHARLKLEVETDRVKMSPPTKMFCKVANWSFFLGNCFFSLCFMIPPQESTWWHTIPFVVYMVVRYLAITAGEFFNRRNEANPLSD
mgnify:CR=1 FL=1